MNHETHSMARITATRAIYDYGDYYRPRNDLAGLECVALLCFAASLIAFYWLAGVM